VAHHPKLIVRKINFYWLI